MSNNATIKRFRACAFHKQRGLCFYCDQPMWLTDPERYADTYGLSRRQAMIFRATAEHLRARCNGGKDTPSNIVAACGYCNRLRHARQEALEPDRYRVLVQRRIAQHRWNYRRFVGAGIQPSAALPAPG